MNSFGRLFRITLFGESHGPSVGVSIDGVPTGMSLTEDDFAQDLARRKAGKPGTTPRVEPDLPKIVSGVVDGHTTGAPLTIIFENTNTRSKDYSLLKAMPRPGHSDFGADLKYNGYNDIRGGGHFSARLTLGIVAAGVVAKRIVGSSEINAELVEAGGDKDIAKAVDAALEAHDSIGGVVLCTGKNIKAGLGEPYFDKFDALLGHILFAVPAVKAVEIGSGVEASRMSGSKHNDRIISKEGATATNNAGGIVGGISNGNDLVVKVTFKPTSSIGIAQETYNFEKDHIDTLVIEGRHDACVALRAPVIVEACVAIVTADLYLMSKMYDVKGENL